MHYPASVLLSHVCKVKETISSYGCSGVIITDNWVLTHGSVLHPDARGTSICNFFKNIQPNKLTTVPSSLTHDLSFRALWKDSGSFVIKEGSATVTWTCSRLQTTFATELQNWSFQKRVSTVDELAPVFLMIQLNSNPDEESNDKVSEAKKVLQQFYERDLGCPTIGSDAEVISTPFGFPSFLNSVTRGIISNIVGLDDCLFITDASTTSGSEGAPIYIVWEKKRFICGLVISLSLKMQSFTFGVSLEPSLRQALYENIINQPERYCFTQDITATPFYDTIRRSIVAVRCGVNWGTGIIVEKKKGYILTCAHVITEAPRSCIKVLHWKDNDRYNIANCNAKLVYATPNELAYDVAMLRVEPNEMDLSLRNIVIETTYIPQGENVAVVGYPFSTNSPTISRGIIAKFSSHMLQTTCCVQSGISGGPVVRWPTGEMLGMVVCNILCPTQNIPQPKLNFAIPSLALKSVLDEFYQTNDPKTLEKFISQDESVQRDWQLSFPPRAKL